MSIYRIRAASFTNDERSGIILGTVEATDAYTAAVEGSRKHFKPIELPKRQTSWPGKSGSFSVTCVGNEIKLFYVEVMVDSEKLPVTRGVTGKTAATGLKR